MLPHEFSPGLQLDTRAAGLRCLTAPLTAQTQQQDLDEPATTQMPAGAGAAPACLLPAAGADLQLLLSEDSATLTTLGSDPLSLARQHHLLRHSLPTEQRGESALMHFGAATVAEAARVIKKMSQRDLQAKFKAVYGAKTHSNNNNWLRRKLLEAIGLDPNKGAGKKAGAVGAPKRRRAAAKPAGGARGGAHPRRASLPQALPDTDQETIAEALLALGHAALLEDSDGCVPSTSSDDREQARDSLCHWGGSDGAGDDATPTGRCVPQPDFDDAPSDCPPSSVAKPEPAGSLSGSEGAAGDAGKEAVGLYASAPGVPPTMALAPLPSNHDDLARMLQNMGAMYSQLQQYASQLGITGASPAAAAAAAPFGLVLPPAAALQLGVLQQMMALPPAAPTSQLPAAPPLFRAQ